MRWPEEFGAGLAWIAGRRAFPNRRPLWTFVSGALVWSVALLVPLAGGVAFLAALVLSMGLGISADMGAGPDWFHRTVMRRGELHHSPFRSGCGARRHLPRDEPEI